MVGAFAGTLTPTFGNPEVSVGPDGLRTSAPVAPASTSTTTMPAATESTRCRPATPAMRCTRPSRAGSGGGAVGSRCRVRPALAAAVLADAVPASRTAAGRPGQDVAGTGGGDLEGRAGAGEEGGEAVVVEHGHGPVSSERGASPAPARAHRAGSAARRRRASCRRDFTVPWRRPMARAMSRSLRSA